MIRFASFAALCLTVALAGCSSNSDVNAGAVSGEKGACCKEGSSACCKDKAQSSGNMGAVEGEKAGCCKAKCSSEAAKAEGNMGAVGDEAKACPASGGCCKNKKN